MVNDMAKKKSSKEETEKSFQYSVEVTGLVLILVGIIGFGFGMVGSITKKFAMFLVGEWWPIVLVATTITGIFMILSVNLLNSFRQD